MSENRSKVLDLPIDSRIRFKTPEGYYEGCVKLITSSGFLEVESTLLPDEDYLGTLRFHWKEILDYSILDTPNKVTERVNYSNHVKSKQTLVDAFENSDDDLDTISVSYDDPGLPDCEEFFINLPPAFSHLSSDFMVISTLDEHFKSAISHLKREKIIGLSLEGDKLGRHGTLSWLCIASNRFTYLFDVGELGRDLFICGIQGILQDTNIVKVIHDCRLVSDMLHHQYLTNLVNVFDTQVADKYVETQRRGPGTVRLYVSSLNSCLRNYLNIPEDYLYRLMNNRYVYMYYQRPPCHKILNLMIKNVVYLRSLKERLEECMLEQFQDTVEKSLQVLPSSTDEEFLLGTSVPDRLPLDITMRGIKTITSNYHQKVPLDPSQNVRSRLYSLLQRYSKGKFSNNSVINETLPMKSSDSKSDPSGNSFNSHKFCEKQSSSNSFTAVTAQCDSKSHLKNDDTLPQLEFVLSTSVSSTPESFSEVESVCSENETISGPAFECHSDFNGCSTDSDEGSQLVPEKKESEPYDPWAKLRTELSEYLSPTDSDFQFKCRLVPAGKQY